MDKFTPSAAYGFDPAQARAQRVDRGSHPWTIALSPDAAAAATARDFAAALAARWQARLGDQLLGIYLLGSLAHGGFSRRYSDIDMAVVTEAGLTPADFDAMRADAAAISSELAAKLSIFWTDRTFSAGRFPPLDRADYLDHGVDADRARARDAAAAGTGGGPRLSHRQAVRGHGRRAPRSSPRSRRLEPKSHKPYLRAHLYPARFVYSFMTGRMGSNDDAVEWLKDRAPPGLTSR